MIQYPSAEKLKLRTLVEQFEQKSMAIESHVALMSMGLKIPIIFDVKEDFEAIPTEFVSGGLAKWRVFFGDTSTGVSASQNSWRRGCVMINHSHDLYDEYIYVIDGKLRDHITGDIIVPSEAAQSLHMESGKVSECPATTKGWYYIPSGREHLIAALEDTEFIVKFVRHQLQNHGNQTIVNQDGT